MDKMKERLKKRKEEKEEEVEEEEEEEQKEDQLGEDFVLDARVLTYTSEAGKIADGKIKN